MVINKSKFLSNDIAGIIKYDTRYFAMHMTDKSLLEILCKREIFNNAFSGNSGSMDMFRVVIKGR